MIKLCEYAATKFFTEFYTKMEGALQSDKDNKTAIDRIEEPKALNLYIQKYEGKLYMLPADWIDWKEEWEKNPIIFSDIQVNMNID
jgi:hypothetical protein